MGYKPSGNAAFDVCTARANINPVMFTFIALALLSGCATSYSLPDGSKRIIGFVNMTIPASADHDNQSAGDSIRIKSAGLLLYNHENESGISIGYSNLFLMSLKNDSYIGERQFTQARKQ